MRMHILAIAAVLLAGLSAAQSNQPKRPPDVEYVPTPNPIVDAMLKLAGVQKTDIVYDLGCGDGRIVITAAKQYGARGIGIDINPERVGEARANAKQAGVENLVKFEESDLFDADIRNATVVTLYLLPDVNLKLRPKLLRDLKPGTRIVSHSYDMDDWTPEKKLNIDGRFVYLWKVPAKK